jgi:hypothetical protein
MTTGWWVSYPGSTLTDPAPSKKHAVSPRRRLEGSLLILVLFKWKTPCLLPKSWAVTHHTGERRERVTLKEACSRDTTRESSIGMWNVVELEHLPLPDLVEICRPLRPSLAITVELSNGSGTHRSNCVPPGSTLPHVMRSVSRSQRI